MRGSQRAQGSGLRAQGTGHRSQGTGHRTQGTGLRAQGTGHRAQGTGHRAQGTQDTGLRVQGSGHREQDKGSITQRSVLTSVRFIESFTSKHKKKICFGFDEFGDIGKLDGIEIIKLFRGIIQSQKQSVYIFSGSYESVMNKLFVTSKSPFYRMVKIIEPGFIKIPELIKFVETKFHDLDIKFDAVHIRQGVEFTRGHPYYIRLFIQEYYFQYLQDKKPSEPENIFRNMMLSENNYLKKLWDEISNKKETRFVIIRIIETGKPYTGIENKGVNISRAINELLGKGIIFSEKSGYILSDPLLERFIKERILKIEYKAGH